MGRLSGLAAVAAGMVLAGPSGADGQVHVRVQVAWEWSSDDGRRVRYDDRDPRYRDVRYHDAGYGEVRYRPVAGVRIPPGHYPPRGACRLWYPGRPPGHQPAPVPCHALGGRFHPGVLVVTWQGVMRPVWERVPPGYGEYYRDDPYMRYEGDGWYGDDDWDDDRWDDDRWDDDDRWYDRVRGDDDRRRGKPGRGKGRGGGRG